jgi:hypothetical protein
MCGLSITQMAEQQTSISFKHVVDMQRRHANIVITLPQPLSAAAPPSNKSSQPASTSMSICVACFKVAGVFRDGTPEPFSSRSIPRMSRAGQRKASRPNIIIRCPMMIIRVAMQLPNKLDAFVTELIAGHDCATSIFIPNTKITVVNNLLTIGLMGLAQFSAAIDEAGRRSLATAISEHAQFRRQYTSNVVLGGRGRPRPRDDDTNVDPVDEPDDDKSDDSEPDERESI